MRSGALKDAISRYKYDGKRGWAWIFGRLLAGYLEAHHELAAFDVIVPMPTWVGQPDGARSWDHTGLIVRRAEAEAPGWPFRYDVLVKTRPTPRMTGLSFKERALTARRDLARALEVVRPEVIERRSVLVFDDVFTGGATLREAALKLRAAGAVSVSGIVLARQPYGG